MSIIDEALKGVERAQPRSANGNGAPVVPTGSSALPKFIIAGLFLAVAGVISWWLFTQSPPTALVETTGDMQSTFAKAESTPAQVALVPLPVNRITIENSEQVAELTEPVTALAKRNEEVADGEEDGWRCSL